MHSATKDEMVLEDLIPAMKRGSLNVVGVVLETSSSVERILRVLPQSNVEELAIEIEHDYHYSEEVSPLCAHFPFCNKYTVAFFDLQAEVHISVLSPTSVW